VVSYGLPVYREGVVKLEDASDEADVGGIGIPPAGDPLIRIRIHRLKCDPF